MKALLRGIKQTLAAAGACLKTTWQHTRRKTAALWRLARMSAKQAAAHIKQRLTDFWQAHHQTVVWAVTWLLFGTLATGGLLYVYHTSPPAREWLDALAASLVTPLYWLLAQRSAWAAARRTSTAAATMAHTAPASPPARARPIPGLPQPHPGAPQAA
jgi:hypothetical protein